MQKSFPASKPGQGCENDSPRIGSCQRHRRPRSLEKPHSHGIADDTRSVGFAPPHSKTFAISTKVSFPLFAACTRSPVARVACNPALVLTNRSPPLTSLLHYSHQLILRHL